MITNIREKEIAMILSDSNYSIVHYSDGTFETSSYTQKAISKIRNEKFQMIRRGVYAKKQYCEVDKPNVSIMGLSFKISRRMMAVWCIVMLISVPVFSQNIAPVAVNDTLLVCNDKLTYFNVLSNDYDANGDKLVMFSFTEPTAGELVSASNTGNFRYEWNSNYNSVNFQYVLKDLKSKGIGTLNSNTATVFLTSAAPYYYSGVYGGNNTRETCKSSNSGAVSITGTTVEKNTSYQYILLDAKNGTVTLAPSSGGSVSLLIKK